MEYGLALLGGFCGIPLGMEAFSEPFVGSMLGYNRTLHIGLLFWASCRHPMLTLGG